MADEPDDKIDLDHGAQLSLRCSSGSFAVVTVPLGGTIDLKNHPHPTPCCEFGTDEPPPYPSTTTVRVAVNGDEESLVSSEGALADAALVAWLLTHRDELIRLARVGVVVGLLATACGCGKRATMGSRCMACASREAE